MDPYASRIDEPTRRRRRTTTLELEILEMEFAKCDKPSISERERISDRISRTDIHGPGMNGREIQVWFQNKRQAIRRAQGAYPNCEPLSDRAKARLANEQLFGIKLGPPRNEQTTPPNSFTSPDDSGSSGKPAYSSFTISQYGMPTPMSSATRERRAQLVLSDLGDGHAEVMFSPTPLKPSSPPRVPVLITPIRTPLSRKIAARSASSPALFGTSGARLNKMTGSALMDSTNTSISSFTTPTAPSSANNLGALKSLKRPHSFVADARTSSKHNREEVALSSSKKRTPASKSASHHNLGRGKENVPPILPALTTPSTPAATNRGSHERSRSSVMGPLETGYGQSARKVHLEHSSLEGVAKPSVSAHVRHAQSEESGVSRPGQTGHKQKKMSAEECALSLVSLAHGM